MVLTGFIEDLHDAHLRWQLRKSKLTSPDAALALLVELHDFTEMDHSLRGGSQAAVNMVSTTPPQPLMATTSSPQDDMMGTLIQTFRQDTEKVPTQRSQNSSISRSSSTDGQSVCFDSPRLNRQSVNTNQNHNYRNSNKITSDTAITKTMDTTKFTISKTTDITSIAVHQTSNKTKTIRTKNDSAIIIEQITSPGIVKPVLIAEGWDICLAKVKNHDEIRTIGNKIRIKTETRKITIKTATQTPHSSKRL